MDITIETNDSTKVVDLLGIQLSGGDTFECKASITSGWLSCVRQFYFGKFYAEEFLQSLKYMNLEFAGSAELKAEYEDQFVKVSCGKTGRVVIEGEFVEHSDLTQSFEFGFETDQTILPKLINSFEKLLGRSS